MMEKKSYGVAFVWWLFGGMFGAHRVYITGSAAPLLWYWLVAFGTLSGWVWVDLVRMKKMIDKEYYKYGGGNNRMNGQTIIVNTGTMTNAQQNTDN